MMSSGTHFYISKMIDEYPRFIVEVLKHQEVLDLEAQVSVLTTQLEAKELAYKTLEQRYIRETYMNMELCDILRSHGISFRPLLDRAERIKKFGDDV